MEEKKSIKTIAIVIIIIANILLLIAVGNTVIKSIKNIKPTDKIAQGETQENIEDSGEEVGGQVGEDETGEEVGGQESTTGQEELKGEEQEKTEDKDNKEKEDNKESKGILDTIKSAISSFEFGINQIIEIALFVVGFLLFLLGIFLLKAVKKLN